MKLANLTALVIISTFTLQGCTTPQHGRFPTQMASNYINNQSVTTTSSEHYPTKNPKTVSLYTEGRSPHAAYRVIGLAKVAMHNRFGAQREQLEIHNRMKQLAASIGGDGLINLDTNNEAAQAHVIAFQKILI